VTDSISVFADTNIFLHYPPLAQIDWASICNAMSVELVVCLTVIHELDEKKSDARLSSRAERAIKEIREASKDHSEIRPGVTVSVFNQEIKSADFPDTLSPEIADDRIVHLARLYKQQNPNAEVAIATADFGMELRAQAGGITAIGLESSLRLPHPQDELSKKYKRAITELNEIKARLPRVALRLSEVGASSTEGKAVAFRLEDNWEPIDVEARLDEVISMHPQQSGLHRHAKRVLGSAPFAVTIAAWERYDEKLEKFYGAYKKYLETLNLIGQAKTRCITFELHLENAGQGLATDIDAIIRFPDNLRWIAEVGSKDAEYFDKELQEPEPPEEPQPFGMDAHLGSLHKVARMPDLSNIVRRRDEWTAYATVKRTPDDTCDIHVAVGKLKHGDSVSLGRFYAVFGSWEDVRPFEASFTLSVGELSEKIEGTIAVIVERKTSKTT